MLYMVSCCPGTSLRDLNIPSISHELLTQVANEQSTSTGVLGPPRHEFVSIRVYGILVAHVFLEILRKQILNNVIPSRPRRVIGPFAQRHVVTAVRLLVACDVVVFLVSERRNRGIGQARDRLSQNIHAVSNVLGIPPALLAMEDVTIRVGEEDLMQRNSAVLANGIQSGTLGRVGCLRRSAFGGMHE